MTSKLMLPKWVYRVKTSGVASITIGGNVGVVTGGVVEELLPEVVLPPELLPLLNPPASA